MGDSVPDGHADAKADTDRVSDANRNSVSDRNGNGGADTGADNRRYGKTDEKANAPAVAHAVLCTDSTLISTTRKEF